MSVRKTLSALGLVALTGGAAAPGEGESPDNRLAPITIERLVKRNDADSFATAALMPSMTHAQALSLIERATALAPDRPDLAWLHSQLCAETKDCDATKLELRFRSLDPKNAAAWYQSFERAEIAGDRQAAISALRGMASAERFDTYWTPLTGRSTLALVATGLSRHESLEWVAAGLGGPDLPTFSRLVGACKADRLQSDDMLETCRSTADRLMRGDTYLTEMIGGAIARATWPENSPQWQAALEHRRVYQYRSSVSAKIKEGTADEEAAATEYLELLMQFHNEQDVLRAQLIKAGIPPDPPADWKPALIASPVKSAPTDRQ